MTFTEKSIGIYTSMTYTSQHNSNIFQGHNSSGETENFDLLKPLKQNKQVIKEYYSENFQAEIRRCQGSCSQILT